MASFSISRFLVGVPLIAVIFAFSACGHTPRLRPDPPLRVYEMGRQKDIPCKVKLIFASGFEHYSYYAPYEWPETWTYDVSDGLRAVIYRTIPIICDPDASGQLRLHIKDMDLAMKMIGIGFINSGTKARLRVTYELEGAEPMALTLETTGEKTVRRADVPSADIYSPGLEIALQEQAARLVEKLAEHFGEK